MPARLRHVDPRHAPGRFSRAYAAFSATRLGRVISANLVWKLDPYLLRATVIDDEAERRRLWELADRVFAPYATYRRDAAKANRTIPIVQLSAPVPSRARPWLAPPRD